MSIEAPVKKLNSLPMLYTRGTHYEVGYQIGSTFKERIHGFHQTSERVQKYLTSFLNSKEGNEIYKAYLDTTKKEFPYYIKEIEGIAEGAEMPFEHIFLCNISKEIYNVHYPQIALSDKNDNDQKLGDWCCESNKTIPGQEYSDTNDQDDSGCTTVFLNRPNCKIIAHNEDTDPAILHFSYIVCADITDPDFDNRHEYFTAFSYPGFLAGHAFGFNDKGSVFGMNGLYGKNALVGKAPRYFLNRALLPCETIEDVFKVLKNRNYGSAYCFCLNYANLTQNDMWSIEMASGDEGRLFVHKIPEQAEKGRPAHYVHANHYKIADGNAVECLETKSTFERTKRAEEMKPPENIEEIKNILGDTENKEYPIYRTKSSTDTNATVSTAIFDLTNRTLEIYVDNVKNNVKPLITLPLSLSSNW